MSRPLIRGSAPRPLLRVPTQRQPPGCLASTSSGNGLREGTSPTGRGTKPQSSGGAKWHEPPNGRFVPISLLEWENRGPLFLCVVLSSRRGSVSGDATFLLPPERAAATTCQVPACSDQRMMAPHYHDDNLFARIGDMPGARLGGGGLSQPHGLSLSLSFLLLLSCYGSGSGFLFSLCTLSD